MEYINDNIEKLSEVSDYFNEFFNENGNSKGIKTEYLEIELENDLKMRCNKYKKLKDAGAPAGYDLWLFNFSKELRKKTICPHCGKII